jgi:fumarylacetoacetase
MDSHADSDFTLANLPYGAFEAGSGTRVGVAIGASVLDLVELAQSGLLDGVCDEPVEVFGSGSLNAFLALGPEEWGATRARIAGLLSHDDPRLRDDVNLRERAFVRQRDVELLMPFDVGNVADFYGCKEHAINCGEILRPGSDPIPANWPHMPVATNRHRSTVRETGVPVIRPCGQTPPGPGAAIPRHGPTEKLDFEVELGYVVGGATELGQPIAAAEADRHLFGVMLVNDWSARDIQRWESTRHFTCKSFVTSISPWVVPLAALEPFRVPGPVQEPEVLDYLRVDSDWNLDLTLEVRLETERMRELGLAPELLARVNPKGLYWNAAQVLAHLTSTGATIGPGDLYWSGTISGFGELERGCLLELTHDGSRPLELASGERREYLADGDVVTLSGWGGADSGRVGFGSVVGEIVPARVAARA